MLENRFLKNKFIIISILIFIILFIGVLIYLKNTNNYKNEIKEPTPTLECFISSTIDETSIENNNQNINDFKEYLKNYEGLDDETINNEVNDINFATYVIDSNFSDNIPYGDDYKNIQGVYSLTLYTIATTNYVYVYDYKVTNKEIYNDDIELNNMNIEIANILELIEYNQDLKLDVILNYSYKENKDMKVIKHNIKLHNIK